MENNWFGKEMIWWKGVVENRQDPLFLGRCKVRIFGWHTPDKEQMPTRNLPWSIPSLPIDNGRNPVGLREGDWCWGFFMDGSEAQQPIIVGFIPGIPEDAADPEQGYSDPTSDEDLDPKKLPRPPEFSPISEGEQQDTGATEQTTLGRFNNPNKLPGDNIAFGVLESEYDPKTYKWDVNKDGVYNAADAKLITDEDQDGIVGVGEGTNDIFTGDYALKNISFPMSRYPLEPYLNEPTTPRISRNEKIEETIVAKKLGKLSYGEVANHDNSGVGTDNTVEAEAFAEPKTPYKAIYPYNHVYESESGHYQEVDDTPGAERLHWYHRAGTFREIHPDGTQVDKVVGKGYHFVVDEFNFATDRFANFSAKEAFRINAGQEINLRSGGQQNRDVGGDMNTLIKGNSNTRVNKNSHTVVTEDARILVKGNVYLMVEGEFHVKAKGNIELSSDKKISLKSKSGIHFDAPEIHHLTYGPKGATTPIAPAQPAFIENKADELDDWFEDAPESATLKEGFLWETNSGDLWKPISDSDGNVVTLSLTLGVQHELVEAIPTGVLETVIIKYKHKDNSITQWTVVRPQHVPGKRVIEAGRYGGNGNGGRDHWRFSKPGSAYPKQMFLKIGNRYQFILSSEVRHEAL